MQTVTSSDMLREQTLVRLVNDYQAVLLKVCYMHLKDEEQARDAVQETFIKAYRALAQFRGESSEKTWLVRIAINVCRDMQRTGWFRHVDRRITPEELPEAALQPDAEDVELTIAIMALPVKYREVVLLYYYQNMGVAEVARALGIAQSSVSNRLKRAREKLRADLERRNRHA